MLGSGLGRYRRERNETQRTVLFWQIPQPVSPEKNGGGGVVEEKGGRREYTVSRTRKAKKAGAQGGGGRWHFQIRKDPNGPPNNNQVKTYSEDLPFTSTGSLLIKETADLAAKEATGLEKRSCRALSTNSRPHKNDNISSSYQDVRTEIKTKAKENWNDTWAPDPPPPTGSPKKTKYSRS